MFGIGTSLRRLGVGIAAAALLLHPLAGALAGEAPTLAAKVTAGELPTLENRLPATPMVVDVVERIGDYGGTWRTAMLGGQDGGYQVRVAGYENLVRWTVAWDGIIPNVAKSYEVSPDSRVYTFKLREGMKWSDGVPFTADDIMFWYEDVFLNTELTPNKVPWLMSGDKPVVVEKVNDYEVKFVFAEPNGLFLRGLADVRGVRPTMHPRHYFEQFHPKYNPNVDKLVAEAGLVDWVALFTARGGGSSDDIRFWNSKLPVLNPWMTTVGIDETTTQLVLERNPYYWKVDAEGNQLPYLDRVTFDFVEDVEVLLLRALSGEIDMMDRHFATPSNRSVLFDGQEAGNYHFFFTNSTSPNAGAINFNLTHKDPVLRKIFNNKDFRIGMSYAINRQEIIDLVYVGQGTPMQVAALPNSAYYNEQLATQYTEYNVDLANEYLDKAGLTERDSEGFRLRPDGQRLTIVIDVYSSYQALIDAMDSVTRYWRDVGVNAILRPGDRSIVGAKTDVGDFDVFANRPLDGGGGETPVITPNNFVPLSSLANWAVGWAAWNSAQQGGGAMGADPVEPPDEVKRQLKLFASMTREGNPAKQLEIMKQVLQIAADQFYHLGISTEADGYGVVKNNFHNVPEWMFYSYAWPSPVASNSNQYFLEGGVND